MANNVTDKKKTFRYGMTSLQITNVTHKKVMKLRSQLFIEKKTKKPKLSINLVVLLFGFIYVYMWISA